MEIKKNKEDIIISEGKDSILITKKEYKGDDYKIVLSNKFEGNGYWVNSPGEFEVAGISILAQSSKMNQDIDIIEFLVDDISIVYIKPQFEYSKLIHDNLGQVHILIMQIEEDKPVNTLVNKFDPEILIPMGEIELVKKVLSDSSINITSEDKKFKSKSDQFGNEDSILQTIILD